MEKIISFEKELNFPSMIGEIKSIALDTDLKFINSFEIKGNFIVSGTYKMTEASTIEEVFKYEIPTEITLSEEMDIDASKVGIDNFKYEILNDDILKCYIDILVSGKEKKENIRECDGDFIKEKEIPKIVEDNNIELLDENLIEKVDSIEDKKEQNEIIEMEESIVDENIEEAVVDDNEEEKTISSLFDTFEFAEETFSTYSVYIMRKEDTLDKVMSMYNITKEELNDYNDLNNITIGTKLIIPVSKTNE